MRHPVSGKLGTAAFCVVAALLQVPAKAEPPALSVAEDRLVTPSPLRYFMSVDGKFRLAVRARDDWKTPFTVATLTRYGQTPGRYLWSRALPHEYGPRRALVSTQGEVVLVDEWINIISIHALTVIGPKGKVLRVHEGEDVLALLDVPRREVSAHARVGNWMSAEPVFSEDGRQVILKSAGRELRLDLVDGGLSLVH